MDAELLSDTFVELHVVAASSEAARLLELFQLQSDEGPCLDCFRTGALAPAGIRVGQALADVATISLLHERGMRHSDVRPSP
jgi:hypothetical protein